MKYLTDEQIHEIKMWLSLRHSKTEIAKLYGINPWNVAYTAKKFNLMDKSRNGRPGRYVLPAQLVKAILRDIKDRSKTYNDIALSRQVHRNTVCYIAKKNNLQRYKNYRRGGKYGHMTPDQLAALLAAE